MATTYKPDIGTVISLNTGVVIAGASAQSIEVKTPSGRVLSWAAVIGSDTYSVEHTLVGGDLTESGRFILQAKVTLGAGTWYGQAVPFDVKEQFVI